MVVTEQIRIMVHLDSSLQHFIPKPISAPSLTTAVVWCLDCYSKAQVDDLVARAIASGGSVYAAVQDLGFVYRHGFLDADGNAWRMNYMDPNVVMPE